MAEAALNNPSSKTASDRIDYLDSARAFALILGIVFHASLSFVPVFIGWAVMDVSTGLGAAIFASISHSFRLELFFLIAGFFSHMTFHRDGLAGFVRSRAVRIAIPFIIGWIVLRPLVGSGWIIGSQSMRGEVDILGGLLAGVDLLFDSADQLLVGTHLWFLYYLLLITTLALVVRAVVKTHDGIFTRIQSAADSVTAWLCHSPFGFIVISTPVAVCLWFMDGWGMDTPDKSLIPHLPVLLVYGGFFILGWLIHRQRHCMENLATISKTKILLAVAAMITSLLLIDNQSNYGHPYYQWMKVGYTISYAIMMWTLMSLTLGIFKRVLNRPSKTARYIADASYWLYLIHLPIVVWLQIAIAELEIHWTLKWFGVSLVTVAIALVIYDLLVRNSFIGATLNGRKRPRVLFSR